METAPSKGTTPSLLEHRRDAYTVHLEAFDGPLDLLLHLIRKNELDIRDIPIADITRQYLEYLRIMKDLNLEVAGEFLLMASTLLHIKSRMLLPLDEPEEGDVEEVDPREELVRRLLEYQQYKEAGQVIGARALLGREVFSRGTLDPIAPEAHGDEGPLELDLFDLVDAFRSLLARVPAESFHDVAAGDSLSITDCINNILSLLQERETIHFDELVEAERTRERLVVTFLALLELCRLKLIRIFQHEPCGAIWFMPAVGREDAVETGS